MKRLWVLAVLIGLFAAGRAQAFLTQYSDRSAFDAQGTIVYNYGFDDWGSDFSYPSNPYTVDGVTYTTGYNIIIGTGTSYAPLSNVLCYANWSPLTANIETSPQSFDMFGLDLSQLDYGGVSPIDFTVYTNLNTYSLTGLSVPLASEAMDFYGFVADSGEYFTGFELSSEDGTYYAPAVDNVTLGEAGPTGPAAIPEPATVLLIGSGLAGLVVRRIRKRAGM